MRIPSRYTSWIRGNATAGRGAIRFYTSDRATSVQEKEHVWDNGRQRDMPAAPPMNDSDFRKLLDAPTDAAPKRKRTASASKKTSRLDDLADVPERGSDGASSSLRAASASKKTSRLDDLADVPERGSFPPPLNESDFRNLLGSKIEDAPTRRPGMPPPRHHLGLGRPAPAVVQDEEQDDTRKTIHVLGFDPRAYYIAFELAGCQFLNPVKLLNHKRIFMNNWEFEGKRLLCIVEGRAVYRKNTEVEWVGRGKQPPSTDPIENLIVTVPCAQTKTAIENVMHRISNKTTICLVQDGLGVVEELNETLFQDPTRRPTFLLGHMVASVGFHKQVFYSSHLRRPGKLFLTALERGIGHISLIKFHPPVEVRSAATALLHTLSTIPNLRAGAYPLESFLMQKLPAMVFHSVVEPLAIALDGTYEDVLRNETAMLLADDLLEEIFNVIWAMPELINSSRVIEHCSKDALRKYTVQRLMQKGSAQSQLLSRVRAGKAVDIDYLNGYFVKRGRELGIRMPQNEMMIDVVKARVEGRKMEVEGLVPMETLDSNVPEMN